MPKVIFNTLKLIAFRNHKKANFSFGNGVNLIVGPNGAGKTNILEAINLLATGKSFRARYDLEMIYNNELASIVSLPRKDENSPLTPLNDKAFALDVHKKTPRSVFSLDSTQTDNDIVREFARVVGTISNDKDGETLEVLIVKGNPNTNLSQKTFKVNGTPKPMYETAKYFSTVLFCPQDLDLFTGSPALRRKFLDDLLCKVDQKYKKEHAVYSKAVRQRNRILEKINKTRRGNDELPFWTTEILKTGTYLQEKRTELIDTLNNNGTGNNIEQIYSDISSQASKIRLEYKINQINLERLEKHREHEIYAKTTLVGPHRDDFDFLINNFSISHYGSRGQQRTGVLALKICELDIIDTKNSSSPVLLLDDIFSELDDVHRKALEGVVQKQQTIITSTHADIKAQNIITL